MWLRVTSRAGWVAFNPFPVPACQCPSLSVSISLRTLKSQRLCINQFIQTLKSQRLCINQFIQTLKSQRLCISQFIQTLKSQRLCINQFTESLCGYASCQEQGWVTFNPFTAPACKASGLKVHGRACKQHVFWLYITSTFNAIRFDENPFTCQCEKENKKAKRFRISRF